MTVLAGRTLPLTEGSTAVPAVLLFVAICLVGSALTSPISFVLTLLTIAGCGVYFWKTA